MASSTNSVAMVAFIDHHIFFRKYEKLRFSQLQANALHAGAWTSMAWVVTDFAQRCAAHRSYKQLVAKGHPAALLEQAQHIVTLALEELADNL